MSGSLSTDSLSHLFRNRISRVRVEVRPNVMRGHPIPEKFGDRDHHVCRRNFHLDLIDPTPDMHLSDLGTWNSLANAACQIDLTTGQLDCFEK